MKTPGHMVLGAVAAALPDIVLTLFAWRRDWVPDTHPLVRAHRVLHGPVGVGVAVTLGFVSHLVADHYCRHRSGPDGETVRGVWRTRP